MLLERSSGLSPPLNAKSVARYIEKLGTFGCEASSAPALYHLNRGERGYMEELSSIGRSIRPMREECRISVLMPAFFEERNVWRSLAGWCGQTDRQGSGIPPELFEIIVLVNRPNSSFGWDGTARAAEEFSIANPGMNIHIVKHTFNFPKKKTEKEVGGINVTVPPGVRMGLIFKLAADLAIIRAAQRKTGDRGGHLLHPAGADVYSRNPLFLSEVFRIFDDCTDFLRLNFVLPAGVCSRLPLLWALHEYRMSMSYAYFGNKHLKRHGVFTSGIYADVSGFEPLAAVGEDTAFGNKILQKGASISASGMEMVADNPRRSIYTISGGKILIEAYSGFGTDDGEMRRFSLDSFLRLPLPEEMAFSAENFSRHASGHFRHYFRQALRVTGDKAKAFEKACMCAASALLNTGFTMDDFGFINGRSPSAFGIKIEKLDGVMEKFQGYMLEKKQEWMV